MEPGTELNEAMAGVMAELAHEKGGDAGRIVSVVDATPLKTKEAYRWPGHLGTHPKNLAAILANPEHAGWRLKHYIDLYTTLMSHKMVRTRKNDGTSAWDESDNGVRSFAVFCNHGNQLWWIILFF